jgi:hypothetical protein
MISLVQGIVVSLTRMPLQFHDFNLARGGNFAQSTAAHKFQSNMRSGAKAVTEFLAQNNASSRLTRQIRDESENYGDSIEALVAEAYGIETGTWIGASLDQGVWYDMRGAAIPAAPARTICDAPNRVCVHPSSAVHGRLLRRGMCRDRTASDA